MCHKRRCGLTLSWVNPHAVGDAPLRMTFQTVGSNTTVHVAATPQRVLLDTFVCVLRARARTQNTHKRILQLVVAGGDRDSFLPLLRIVPSRREGTMRSNGKKESCRGSASA